MTLLNSLSGADWGRLGAMFDGGGFQPKRSGVTPEAMLSAIRALRDLELDAPAHATPSAEELRAALSVAEICLMRLIAERDADVLRARVGVQRRARSKHKRKKATPP